MKVVYVDTIFILNLAVNYLLLLGTGKFSGLPLQRKRLVLSALAGALYAVAVYLPHMGFLASAAGKILSGATMVWIGFGFVNLSRYIKSLLLFFLVSLVFGGGVLAVYLASGGAGTDLKGGVLFSRISLKALIISIALCYGVVGIFFAGAGKHGGPGKEISKVKVFNAGNEFTFSAMSDTGNTLRDPLTNAPVLVIETDVAIRFLPKDIRGLFDRNTLREPSELMTILSDTAYAARFRLIPFRTIGTKAGMLIAYKPDRIEIGGKVCKNMLIALSPEDISEGAGYCALIGALK